MLTPSEVTCLQILENIIPQTKGSTYPFLLLTASLCTHGVELIEQKCQFALPMNLFHGLCCLVCHYLFTIWAERLAPSYLQKMHWNKRCQNKQCMCSSPNVEERRGKENCWHPLRCGPFPNNPLEQYFRKSERGHRVLAVLKIKTDSQQVTAVFPLVHKYFV